MDRETIDYIIRYFSKLMTKDESLALNHHMYTLKSSESVHMRNLMIERGWINSDPEVIQLLEHGYQTFEQNVVTRIMAETPEKVFFNNCPECHKLARTPHAKQCRYCGYHWHHLTVAHFKLNNTFQITGRNFFLIGKIEEGKIKEGQRIDLRILGLNKKPKIQSIELALTRHDGKAWEDIALGIDELTAEDKEYLKSIMPVRDPLDIIIE
ncbi:hypothetical protein A1704_02135 [Chryseobacterium cucumeris]|uniref:hypothetical protein n=1 Tax=Chryseobacterium cucumeris TaxID=1813611 RepID=UPI000788E07D|nr:hypothetical protein [Chryseobacterium cucumeris]KYH07495.1 hypothetical protein A1704_02135 [Chryseobacterium cucumeris]